MSERPRTYRTEGVILRRRNLGEADSIFTVFSLSLGKFDAVAKGVRKARSHMRGHLEPLTRTRMMLARGRTLDVFTQAETIDAFRTLHEDLERSALGLYCCELADRFGSEHVEQDEAYWLLVEVLGALDWGAPGHVTRWFELRLLAANGYELQVRCCAVCGRMLPEEETLFSAESGGLVCAGCRGHAGAGRILSVRAIKVLRFAAVESLERFAGVRLDSETAHEVEWALAEAIRFALDRDPASARYVEDVRRLERTRRNVAETA